MLKNREVYNGKSVVCIYPHRQFSSMLIIPTRLAQKYKLNQSDVKIDERGDGDLFIKKAIVKTRTRSEDLLDCKA